MGCKRKRVEDIRFTQGRGNYVDDIKLPGMLHGDFVRSPYAHAKITRIDTSKAAALPGVIAVITAEELKPLGLHWMPTLAGDVQAVLADGKVCFQNQEVAFVVAENRYIADDAIQLVEVEYEALPVLVDPFHSMDPDAPVLRPDLDGKTGRRPWPAQAPEPYLQLGGRRSRGHRRGVQRRRGDDQGADLLSPHPSLAAGDLPVPGVLRQGEGRADALRHLPGAARHPHRGLAALEDPGAQDPCDRAGYWRRLRQQGRRLCRLYLLDRRVRSSPACR